MYLLKTDTYEVVEVSGKTPRYAILSHRWEQKEITFGTINSNALRNGSLSSFEANLRPSATKIVGACTLARQQLFDYIWIDTCCIDRSSSNEITTAINSMYKWYNQADVCYTFLRDVKLAKVGSDMFSSSQGNRKGEVSEWFSRGWTLQELLAPRRLEFYDMNWTLMGMRHDLANLVGKLTAIKPSYLEDPPDGKSGKRSFREASVATKMSWMAGRTTSHIEDIAYSLLGIFNVNLSPMYGEGTKSFSRLLDAIIMDPEAFDESLFAWECPDDGKLRCYQEGMEAPEFSQLRWGLLAPSPDCFKNSANIAVIQQKVEPRRPGCFQKSNQGIFMTLGVKDVMNTFGKARNEISLPLNCWRVPYDQSPETVVLELSQNPNKGYSRTRCHRLSSRSGTRISKGYVLGVDRDSSTITIPQPCIEVD